MNYSTLNEIPTSRGAVESFGGYNHNIRISDGEFYDMGNLTSDLYPTLSPRRSRGAYAYPSGSGTTHSTNGIIAKDTLCYADGTAFYINNIAVAGLTLTDTPKQLVSMGAYVIIMPDKKYVNTADVTDYGDIEVSFSTVSGNTVTFEMCKVDGTIYTDVTASPQEPQNPQNAALWIDTSSTPHVLKQYSSASAAWTTVVTTYVRISYPNIASSFKQYDGVTISGIDTENLPQLKDLDGQTSVLWDAYHDVAGSGAGDYIVVVGIIDTRSTQTSVLTVSRKMPNLDFIVESENRLWGCRYGISVGGDIVNEIYACKLGDFKNWNCFMGISTDSYVASCGTDGAWTGAITHLGYPLFFKENCLHKVYGNFPSNFQVQTTACRGVMKGAGNSLAIVNEALFYKSRSGVCVYDGSLPSEISSAFGDVHYSSVDDTNTDFLRNGAVAGAHNNKYYISMRSELDGLWHLFVYDAAKKMWHKEDNTRADAFCSCRGEMYYIDHATKSIKTVFGSGTVEQTPVEWFCETGTLGTDLTDQKYISRVNVRMSLAIGGSASFWVNYDSELNQTGGFAWNKEAEISGTSLRSFSIPIRPRRCDHFRIRIEGEGDAKIFSIAKTIEQGSDI